MGINLSIEKRHRQEFEIPVGEGSEKVDITTNGATDHSRPRPALTKSIRSSTYLGASSRGMSCIASVIP